MSDSPVLAAALSCSQCGRQYSAEDVLIYGAKAVCGSCKQAFFQRLLEGATLPGQLVYAGFWIRVLARCVDAIPLLVANQAISGILEMVVRTPVGTARWTGLSTSVLGFSVLLDVIYNAWFVWRFGGSPGKLALGLKVVIADGGRVSFGRSLGRALAYYVNVFTLYIGCLIAAFDEEKRALHDRICETRVVRS